MATNKEKIFLIADELDRNGQIPTLALVRKQLGGGSFTTISQAVNEWKIKKAATACLLPSESVPQSVSDLIAELGTKMWSYSLDLAHKRFEAEHKSLENSRIELELGKVEAAELTEQVIGELEILQERFLKLELENNNSSNEANTLREQLRYFTDCSKTAEVRALELEKRASDLNSELARVHEQNANLVKVLSNSIEGINITDVPKM